MDIKGLILRRLYVPQRLRVLCDESCPYCGDSVIIIAVIFIIIIIISISILSLLQKNTSCGFKFEKILFKSSSYLYILYLKSVNSL